MDRQIYFTTTITTIGIQAVLPAYRQAYTYLFSGTIRENIKYGKPDATDREMERAAVTSNADAPILILDEATSSVDTRTELHIQEAMLKLLKGRTSFIIAHRLSTIRDADTIMVTDKGVVVEQGSHESLIRARGKYSDLYFSQLKHEAT